MAGESLAFAVYEFLEMLGEDTRLEHGQLHELKKLIEQLRGGWKQVEALAKETTLDSGDEPSLKQLAADIREVTYLTENQLERTDDAEAEDQDEDSRAKCFLINCLGKRGSSSFSSANTLQFTGRIKEIREGVYRITRNHVSISPPDLKQDPAGPWNVVVDESCQFVGRKEEMKQLQSYVNEEGQVVSISGMGGTGKTALASNFYNDGPTKKKFPIRIWVPVSHKFERRRILEHILTKYTYQSFDENVGEGELVRVVSSYLESSKALIVLDDICSLKDWECLRVIFPRSNQKLKILITTRMKEVAKLAAPRCIHLTWLTDDEGCELLVRNAPTVSVADGLRKDQGKNILNFWGGLPLTIVSFLRSMMTKHTWEEWDQMVNQRTNCTFSQRLEFQEVKTTLEALASSYRELPHNIKPLFLYMGVLQDDHWIEVEKLCLLWFADRFISLKPLQRGESLLTITQNYVTEIAERSMVDLDETEVSSISRVKYCRLKRLMQDLSLLKNKDECFFKVVKFARGKQLFSVSSSWGRIYRVAVDLDEYEDGCGFPLKDDEEKLRIRVLLLSAKKKKVWPEEFRALLIKFKNLKVLDFDGFNFERTILPEGIATAVHLRYLSFKECILGEVPSSIGNLTFLYILDLRVQDSTTITPIIPNVLWKMKRLRHLYFPKSFNTHNGSKLRLEGLTKLETITNFNACMFELKDLLGLKNLQYLDSSVVRNHHELESIINRMTMNSTIDLLRASLEIRDFDCYTEERHSVFRKVLECPCLEVLIMEGHLSRIPMHHRFSENLIKIAFIGSELIEDPMGTLEMLPKLRVLDLNDAFAGKKIVCTRSGFVQLKVLKILNLHSLEEWTVEEGAMPKLSSLILGKCEKLEMLPQGLQFVRGLRELDVSRMSKDFQNRIRKVDPNMGKDEHKAQHVPSIIFVD